MTFELGDTVWIPCQVRSGVFPNECKVSIDLPTGRWAGFVDVTQLRHGITAGHTALRATVVKRGNGGVAARLPGQTREREYLAITEI